MIDDLTPPHWGAEPITTAPERIWLQDNGDFDAASEVTWCQHRIDDNDTEYVRADLAAVPAQVRVKPLVWSEVDGDEYAEVCGLVYILYEPSACDETNGWYVLEETTNTAIEADGSIEAAKAAAQADYESRILAAIEPQPDPRDAVIARLVEALENRLHDQECPCNACSPMLAALAAAKAAQHG